MVSHIQQYTPYDPYDHLAIDNAPTRHRYSFGGNAELLKFRRERQLLYPGIDFEYYTDPHRSPTEDAILNGDLENVKPRSALPGNHPLWVKFKVGALDLTSMAEDVRQAGSLFTAAVDESMGEKGPSELFPAAAMQVCDKVAVTVPANIYGAEITIDTQATRDTQDTQSIRVAQDNGQLRKRAGKHSGQEENPEDRIAEEELENGNTTGSSGDDAGDIEPMSPPSPQSSLLGSCSDYSSDSTSATSVGFSKLSLTGRCKNPNKRRRSDPPSVRKKNKQASAEPYNASSAARDIGPPGGTQRPPQDEAAGPVYSPANPKASQSRQFGAPMPVNVLPSDHRRNQAPFETTPPQIKKQRAEKKKYSAGKKAAQAACRQKGSCTECKTSKRKCNIADRPPGEPCESCAKRNAKLKLGEAPLECVSWKNEPPQRPPSPPE